ncbi:nitrate- and nitrite sensing domain-containing protein [Streptomyces sp. NPDC051976]|uniref:sensor histidine kinase n=1 Tax=Streptomyces sp. NPDC051976 TaxID=3154947 RepID=UPI003424DE79
MTQDSGSGKPTGHRRGLPHTPQPPSPTAEAQAIWGRGTPPLRGAFSWRTIRGRVSLILAVPSCMLLGMAGVAVASHVQEYQNALATREDVEVGARIQSLVYNLQGERILTNGLLAGDESDRALLAQGRKEVDAFRRKLDDEPAVADAMGRFGQLARIRASVDSGTADQEKVQLYYTDLIEALNAADPAVGKATSGDRRLRDSLAALQALAEVQESGSQEINLLGSVVAAGSFRGTEFLDFIETWATRRSAMARFFTVATPAQSDAVKNMLSSPATQRLDAMERAALKTSDGSRIHINAAGLNSDMTRVGETVYRAQQRIHADAKARAETLSEEATLALAGYLAVAVLVAAALVTAAVVADRSITKPLDALAREADDVARRRLPDTVARIHSGELVVPPEYDDRELPGSAREVSRAVSALRNVEQTALGLAAEQAVLRRTATESLASLGRRNQGLLRRQLSLITALEQQELDPEALAELFKLDHLATRMRRNAESLLVLADERSPQISTVTASSLELVQSALGEVEQYQRVAILGMEPCRISGRAVGELSHLLAELIENALAFSPPTQPVDVHGWADGGEYCLAIVDHGVGMSPEDLTLANARIAGKDAARAAAGRYLGHYVVGRLADRLGVEALLSDTPGGGVSALVTLPAQVLAPDEVPPTDPRSRVSSLLNGFRAGVARADAR